MKENPKCSVPSHIYVSGSFADSMAKKKFCKDILIEQESMKGQKKKKLILKIMSGSTAMQLAGIFSFSSERTQAAFM